MSAEQNLLKIASLILSATDKHLLKKAVLSKPTQKDIKKTVLTEKLISGVFVLQAEIFHKDNKATHKNIQISELTPELFADFLADYMQINLISSVGECEYRRSSSGNSVLLNEKKLEKFLNEFKTAVTTS